LRGAIDPSNPGLAATTAKAPANDEFAAPTADELNALLPQFRVEGELGRGGMGVVYRAVQLNLQRPVAIKLLAPHLATDPAFAERFTREARALARMSHPNIVAVYDFGQVGTYFYLVMELVDGANLRRVMQDGRIEPKQALEIVPQVCDALQYAHDEGIVHRDVKPENILLDKRGRVKIADFGLAKLLGHAPDDVSLTGTQQVMGTFRYMAPEQMEGNKAVDHRTDIYSLGVVFYELLTGELPIGRFAPPSKKVQIDIRLDEVVLRALDKEPEQRYQQVSQVKTDVETIVNSRGPIGGGETPAAASRLEAWWFGQSRVTRNVLISLLLLILMLGMIGFFSASQGSELLESGRKHTYFRIGLWDPWYRSDWTDGKGGSSKFSIFTGSILFCIAILASIRLLVKIALWERRRRGAKAPRPAGLGDMRGSADISQSPPARERGLGFRFETSPKVNMPSADYRPAAPATSATPVQAAPAETPATNDDLVLPLKFRLRAFLFAALAWLLFLLLWNVGIIGLAIACASVGFMVLRTARKAQAFLPLSAWRLGGGPVYRKSTSVWSFAFATLGAYFVFVGCYQAWDALNWNFQARTAEQFKQEYQGAEHRLLRELPGYDKDVPRAELTRTTFQWKGVINWTTTSPPIDRCFGSFQTMLFLISGLWLIFCPYAALLCTPGRTGGAKVSSFWPPLQLTFMTLLPLAPYAFAMFVVPDAMGTRFRDQGQPVTVDADIKTVMQRIDAWTEAHDFASGDFYSWQVNRVPTGGALATVEQRHYWRPNVFDRWQMTLRGLQRAAPDFALEIIGDAAGHKTTATVSARLRGTACTAAAAVQAQFDDLCRAIQGQSDRPSEKSSVGVVPKSVEPVRARDPSNVPTVTAPVKAAHDGHSAKPAVPTPEELAHIFSELPQEFTKGLIGSNEKSIKDLDTLVWAIDFDDGPADFWLEVKETGQESFPVRLPSRDSKDVWRIPTAKAHVLLWIQPRMSNAMSDKLRGALANMPSGCTLGIDVDGKAVARINYDVPVAGVGQSIPHPLWFGWESEEMQTTDIGFDADMASHAMRYLGRKATSRASSKGINLSAQLGLMYRPDRLAKKKAD
jgi:serine/threonine protein kinase